MSLYGFGMTALRAHMPRAGGGPRRPPWWLEVDESALETAWRQPPSTRRPASLGDGVTPGLTFGPMRLPMSVGRRAEDRPRGERWCRHRGDGVACGCDQVEAKERCGNKGSCE